MGRVVLIILVSVCCSITRAEPPALRDVVRVTTLDGVIRVEPDELYVNSARPINARGPEAIWQISVSRASRVGAPQILSMVRPAGGTAKPEEFWTIAILAYSDQVQITAARAMQTPRATTLRLLQRGNQSVRVSITDGEAPRGAGVAQTMNLDATNLLALRERNPQLVARFIVPLLAQICGEDPLLPGATDVYRAFYEIVPQDKDVAAFDRLVPMLSATSAEQRVAASARLEALGAGGACAALHADRSTLPPEALARVEAYLDDSSRRRGDDPRLLRDDLSFLADCMEFAGDPRVRSAARARFEQLTGRAIPPADWAHASEYARGQIAAAGAASRIPTGATTPPSR